MSNAPHTPDIQARKADHIDLCATDKVAFRNRSTLLECVQLVHQALPDLHVDDVNTSVRLLGKTLRAPLVIAAMTGGTDRAAEINQALATIAESRGIGFGLGSQRAMERKPETAWTYQVRQWAPTTLILGNVGVVQARELSSGILADLVSSIGADALCLHMNPAMELIQPGGDRDFRRGRETFARLVNELSVPIVAKETGCGVSRQTARVLKEVGVHTVDVSGSGGTSWVAVETLRADGDTEALGQSLWDWGIPTAASVAWVSGEGLETIATGGIQTGMDVARALALGASAAGIARPVLQAFLSDGKEGAEKFLDKILEELRAIMLLCGAGCVPDLARAPRVVRGELRDWLCDAS